MKGLKKLLKQRNNYKVKFKGLQVTLLLGTWQLLSTFQAQSGTEPAPSLKGLG